MAASLAIVSFSCPAHHAAEGIADDEVYEMIDSLLADTPHADMTLEDLGAGMTMITISTQTVTQIENMIDDGLLDYASLLDGQTSVNISFSTDGTTITTITQMENQ
jgi:hypothetical protein